MCEEWPYLFGDDLQICFIGSSHGIRPCNGCGSKGMPDCIAFNMAGRLTDPSFKEDPFQELVREG